MVEYKCFRCGYQASQKCNFKNHLNRKNICKPILENISIEEIKIIYKFDTVSKLPSNNTPTTVFQQEKPAFNSLTNNRQNQEKPAFSKNGNRQNQAQPAFKNIICEYCNKSFLYKIPQKLQILFSLFVLTLLMLISYNTLIDVKIDKFYRNTTIIKEDKINFLMND